MQHPVFLQHLLFFTVGIVVVQELVMRCGIESPGIHGGDLLLHVAQEAVVSREFDARDLVHVVAQVVEACQGDVYGF